MPRRLAPAEIEVRTIDLADWQGTVEALADELRAAHALLFGTGVYWGSWGSPLQRFLEIMTSYEVSDLFLGKPAGVVVTMDSVGGSDVAFRLLGALATLGCLIPPLPTIVISRVGVALAGTPGNEDVWQPHEVELLVHNLVVAMDTSALPWRAWPVKQAAAVSGQWPASGPLDLGIPRFLPVEGEEDTEAD